MKTMKVELISAMDSRQAASEARLRASLAQEQEAILSKLSQDTAQNWETAQATARNLSEGIEAVGSRIDVVT